MHVVGVIVDAEALGLTGCVQDHGRSWAYSLVQQRRRGRGRVGLPRRRGCGRVGWTANHGSVEELPDLCRTCSRLGTLLLLPTAIDGDMR